LVFALAAQLVLDGQWFLPVGIPSFVHMKGAVNGWGKHDIWTDRLHAQFAQKNLTVGSVRQRLPFHYHVKNFASPEIIAHYEGLYGI